MTAPRRAPQPATSERATGPARGTSVVAMLSPTPRIFVFFAVLLPGAIAIGALITAKLEYATAAFGGEVGVGALATMLSVAGAIAALPAGVLADRFNARHLLLISGLTTGLLVTALGLGLTSGLLSPGWLLAGTALEGIAMGMGLTALPNTQAALVPANARGAAEIVNMLRFGVGLVIGGVLADFVADASLTLLVAGPTIIASVVAAWLVASPVRFARARGKQPLGDVVRALRDLPLLRAAVVGDALMRFVVPVSLTFLFVVDRGAEHLITLVVIAGTVGALSGNLGLAIRGLSGNLPRILFWTFSVYTVTLAIGAILLTGDWLVGQPVILMLLIALGSAASSYGQSLLVALVQQRSPDEIRGRLSGLLSVPRLLLSGLATALLTLVVSVHDTRLATALLALLAVGSIIALRGFRRVGRNV